MDDLPRQYVIRESGHRIHNALSEAKLATLGRALRLPPGSSVLDLASGSGEMLCTWARDLGLSGTGVDISTDFTRTAQARAAELGVMDRVELVHGEAAAHARAAAASGATYDVVACLGATWVGGGPLGTLDLMAPLLRPGGLALVGEPYWRRTPPDEETVRACHAESVDDFAASLPALVESFTAHGWDVVELVLSSPDDWDRYHGAQWLSTRRWLDAHPNDPLAPEMRAELDRAPLQHARFVRDYLGWGVFVLMARA